MTGRSANPECHPGRLVDEPIVRELLRALGVRVCADCHRAYAIAGRRRWLEPRSGRGA